MIYCVHIVLARKVSALQSKFSSISLLISQKGDARLKAQQANKIAERTRKLVQQWGTIDVLRVRGLEES